MSPEQWLERAAAVVADESFIVIAIAVAVGGFLRGFVGFGAALVSVPVISLVFGPQLALPIVVIMGLPSVVQLLPDAVRHSEPPIVVPISIAIFLGVPLGTWVLVSVDPDLMKIVISSLVLLMVGSLALGWKLDQEVRARVLLLSGFAGGLVQGAAGIGGPPVVAVALSRAGSPERQRGNVLAVMTVIACCSMLSLYHFGLVTVQALVIGVILFPIYSLFSWIGSRYFSSGGRLYFRRAAMVVLGVIGLVTLIVGVSDYLEKV